MGRTAGTQPGLQAVLGVVTAAAPWWSVIFLTEADAFQDGRAGHHDVHHTYRHYPGIGSWAMAFLIRKDMGKYVRSCKWRGRCGAIHLCDRQNSSRHAVNLYILGIHGAHGDLLIDTLADLASLIRLRPFGSKVAIVGDFNVDMLPTFTSDPWAGEADRHQHHAERRALLESLIDCFALELHLPSMWHSVPGGPFAENCLMVPITRIPVGDSVSLCKPSILSYAIASHGLIREVGVHWEGVPADHAIIVTDCTPVYVKREAAKTRWKCVDDDACVEWIKTHCPASFDDLEMFHSFLLEVQRMWGDRRSCKARRVARVPDCLRDLYARIAGSTTEPERRALQQTAWNTLKKWKEECNASRVAENVRKGRVLSKAKKLHTIDALVLPGDLENHSVTDNLWQDPIHKQFADKWGASRHQLRLHVLDFIFQAEAHPIRITWDMLFTACTKPAKRSKLDHYGVSVEVIRLLCTACPDTAAHFFESLLGSTPLMASISIQGRLYGKESCTTPPSQIRAILPLPAVLQVCDCILSSLLDPIIDTACPHVPGTFVGARPRTQVLDIAHGLHLVIEKALDGHSRGAIAQEDIEKFYDSISLLRVARWLVNNGAPHALAACVLRQQLLPQVVLNAGGVAVPIRNRSTGSLTGSRVAGAMGRVPVESTIRDRHFAWKRHGFKAGTHTLTVATYVDNIYSAGASLHDAIAILEDFEAHLQTHWGLRIKPSSRMCLVPRGNHELPRNDGKWPLHAEFTALGHTLQDNGSTQMCWQNTAKAMWRAFFGNCNCENARLLPTALKQSLMDRAVLPVMQHRDTRWPPTTLRQMQIDTVQRKMVCSIMRLQPYPHENPVEYLRRRNRQATETMNLQGKWTTKHCKRVVAWNDHLRRPRNDRAWAAILLKFRDEQWIEQQRRYNSVGNESRTRTRALPGFVAMRWHDGVRLAAAHCARQRA